MIHYQAMTPESPECEFFTELTVEELLHLKLGNLSNVKVVCCGGPNFVYSVLGGLESKGFESSQMLSDVFAYAPRPE